MGIERARETCTFTGDSLALTIEQALESLIALPAERALSGETFLLGYAAEAGEMTTLVREAVAQIQALAADHAATIVGCEVSGVQPTDEGQRIWGTIECTPSRSVSLRQPMAEIGGVKVEKTSPLAWRLTVDLTREETP